MQRLTNHVNPIFNRNLIKFIKFRDGNVMCFLGGNIYILSALLLELRITRVLVFIVRQLDLLFITTTLGYSLLKYRGWAYLISCRIEIKAF